MNVNDAENNLVRLANIGQISAGIAHEVRNPLTAVKGFLQLLREQTSHKYLDIASSELDRAISALQNLLQVSKPDFDDEPYGPINLCTELESLLFLFQDQIYRVNIEKDFQDCQMVINGKRNQLKKALFNLLKNAFEAISDEGMIKVKHYSKENRLMVSIRDSGIGLSPDQLKMLGTPFYTTKVDGTGMGLTQVYSTIYQHEAEIEVRSKEGEGTEFILAFPLGELAAEPSSTDPLQNENVSVKQFLKRNKAALCRTLTTSAESFFKLLEASERIDPQTFTEMMEALLDLTAEGGSQELTFLSQTKAKAAAEGGVPVRNVLEFLHIIRMELIRSLEEYATVTWPNDRNKIQAFERNVHAMLDTCIVEFAESYQAYSAEKESLRRELEEIDSAVLIPVGMSVCLLPLSGLLDEGKTRKIKDKITREIERLRLRHIVVDLTGISMMDTAAAGHLLKMISALRLMGVQITLTGIRAEIANGLVDSGMHIADVADIKADLYHYLQKE